MGSPSSTPQATGMEIGEAVKIFLDRIEVAEATILRLTREKDEAHGIVSRIWDLFGNPTHEDLAGRSIYDLIDAMIEADSNLAALKERASVEGLARTLCAESGHEPDRDWREVDQPGGGYIMLDVNIPEEDRPHWRKYASVAHAIRAYLGIEPAPPT